MEVMPFASFIYSALILVTEYLLSTYHVLDTVLDAGETTVIKKTKFLPLWSLYSSRKRQILNRQAKQETDGVLWRKRKKERGYASTAVGG